MSIDNTRRLYPLDHFGYYDMDGYDMDGYPYMDIVIKILKYDFNSFIFCYGTKIWNWELFGKRFNKVFRECVYCIVPSCGTMGSYNGSVDCQEQQKNDGCQLKYQNVCERKGFFFYFWRWAGPRGFPHPQLRTMGKTKKNTHHCFRMRISVIRSISVALSHFFCVFPSLCLTFYYNFFFWFLNIVFFCWFILLVYTFLLPSHARNTKRKFVFN